MLHYMKLKSSASATTANFVKVMGKCVRVANKRASQHQLRVDLHYLHQLPQNRVSVVVHTKYLLISVLNG